VGRTPRSAADALVGLFDLLLRCSTFGGPAQTRFQRDPAEAGPGGPAQT